MAGKISDIAATLASPTGTVWLETEQDGTSKKWRAIQASASAPTVNDDSGDSYAVGSIWIETATPALYIAKDVSSGAAVWQRIQNYDGDLATIAGLTATTDSFMQAKAGAWAARTVAQVIADLQAGGLNHPGHVSGNWFWLVPRGTRMASGSALVNGAARFLPFQITRAVTISTLGVHIATLMASGNLQLAIYANDATTGRPTGSELAKTGNISTSATGVVSGAISGGNVTLQPGWYWMAVNVDATAGGTAACKTLDGAEAHMSSLVGSATQSDISAAVGTSGEFLSTSLTFNTWGDVTAASWSIGTSSSSATLMAKVA